MIFFSKNPTLASSVQKITLYEIREFKKNKLHHFYLKNKKSKLKLNRLGVDFQFKSNKHNQSNRNNSTLKLNGINLTEDSKTAYLYQYIYNLIDQNLTYPAEFYANNIKGTANTVIVFSKNGDYLKDKTKINSTSRYLSVLVRHTLNNALQSLPQNLAKKISKSFQLTCTFTFEITEHNDPVLIAANKSIIDKKFLFYRNFQ